MSMDFHGDPILREQLITRYLRHRLTAELAEEWESHYLACERLLRGNPRHGVADSRIRRA